MSSDSLDKRLDHSSGHLVAHVNKMKTSMTNSNFGDTTSSAEPAVSIVVPCRNEKDRIETALESILAQESPPGGFEVIVADGMSHDGTRELLLQLAIQDKRLRVIDNQARITPSGMNV